MTASDTFTSTGTVSHTALDTLMEVYYGKVLWLKTISGEYTLIQEITEIYYNDSPVVKWIKVPITFNVPDNFMQI